MIRTMLILPDHVHSKAPYARRCISHSVKLGETPMVCPSLFCISDVDDIEAHKAFLSWFSVASRAVVYADHGLTDRMQEGIEHAMKYNVPILHRSILNTDHE